MILATSRFLEVQCSEWRAVSSCPWKGNRDECWIIAKLHDNYSIHYFGNRMGKQKRRQRGSWEVTGSWRSHSYAIYVCVCVCVCMFVCAHVKKKKSSAFMYICKSAYPFPLCTLIATLVRIAFNTETHETMGYKLAFQPDIFDMISASHLVSLLFVSFLPWLL